MLPRRNVISNRNTSCYTRKLSRVFLRQPCGEREPTRQISHHPTHGTHANVARSLSSTAASLALNSADTLSTTTGHVPVNKTRCQYIELPIRK